MLAKVLTIDNGGFLQKYNTYKCDSCGTKIEQMWPHLAENNNSVHYCGDCAFKLGKVTERQYVKDFLFFIGFKKLRAAINPETGEIELTVTKKFSWEKSAKDYRTEPKYKKWRNKVFMRDGFTCQKCGQVGGNLEAHHIRPFAKYKSDRLKVSNGVTLCKKCHRKIHKEKDCEWIHTG